MPNTYSVLYEAPSQNSQTPELSFNYTFKPYYIFQYLNVSILLSQVGGQGMYLIYLPLYPMGPNLGMVLHYPLVFSIFYYVELYWDSHLLPHGQIPGKTQCTSTQFSHQVLFWKYLYETVARLGPEGNSAILQFIWMLARGHTTRPLSTYQLCLRSWLMFFI